MTRALALYAFALALGCAVYWPIIVWAVACPVLHIPACTAP